MKRKAEKVMTFPQPGSSLIKSSKNITAPQQHTKVVIIVGTNGDIFLHDIDIVLVDIYLK